MAVKGAVAKQAVADKILSIFEGAFLNGKELRIPMIDNGERVEIKVALTCAKDNVGGVSSEVTLDSSPTTTNNPEVTEEEKQELKKVISQLF